MKGQLESIFTRACDGLLAAGCGWGQVKEVALIHSEGILAGEMKHGPLATKDNMYNKMQSVVQPLCARSARLIVICNEGDQDIRGYANKEAIFIEVWPCARFEFVLDR